MHPAAKDGFQFRPRRRAEGLDPLSLLAEHDALAESLNENKKLDEQLISQGIDPEMKVTQWAMLTQ